MKKKLTSLLAIIAAATIASSCTRECKCEVYTSAPYGASRSSEYTITTKGKCSDLDNVVRQTAYDITATSSTTCRDL